MSSGHSSAAGGRDLGTGPPAASFSLPALDDPPSTELGVILLGLEIGPLLAGLGLAALAEDPTAVTLLADQARHAGTAQIAFGHLAELGAARWRSEREALGESPGAASLRNSWAQAYRAVQGGRAVGPATAVYLTACWLRRAEIETYLGSSTAAAARGLAAAASTAEGDPHVLSQSTAG